MDSGTHVIGYVRVSVTERERHGHGLDAQEATIRQACAARGWTLVEIIRDEGRSGRDLDRPGLARALAMIASGQASGLVAAKLDRISRSVIDFGTLLDWTDRAGAALVALDLGVDTSTPGGRLVANVFASVAQWERETIGARTAEGLAAARAKGQSISRPAVADDPLLLAQIQTMRSEGLSFQRIADRLNAQGVPTLRGADAWGPSAVRSACGYRRPKAQHKTATLPELRRRAAA